MNQLNLNEKNTNVRLAKQQNYQAIGLKVFVAGLFPPLGPIIRARQPKTLKEALRFCSEEDNYNYVQNFAKSFNKIPASSTQNQQKPPTPPFKQSLHSNFKPPGFFNKPVYFETKQFNPPHQIKPPGYSSNSNPNPFYRSNNNNTQSNGFSPNKFGNNQQQSPSGARPYQNFYKKPLSGRTHVGYQNQNPNFQIEEEHSQCNEPCNTQYDGAYYYNDQDQPYSNYDEMEANPQHFYSHNTNVAPCEPDTPEDELNFHIAEEAAMKR